MRTILTTAMIILLASCTTTVKRLELTSVTFNDGSFSAYYQVVDEIVPKGDGPNDSSGLMSVVSASTTDFQLFPNLYIRRGLVSRKARLSIKRDAVGTVGQTLLIDGDKPLLSSPVYRISSASLSPDGKTVAFSCRERPTSPWTIWFVDSNGSNPRMLCNGRDPDWLNADTIVYAGRHNGKNALITCKTNGSGRQALASTTLPLRHVAVGPQGKRIAYAAAAAKDGSDADVWVFDSTTAKANRLTTHPARDDAPAWAADGKTVHFRSTRSGDWAIWSNSP